MERIASFTVDHDVLVPGLYLSRQDGDVVTLDLRFKKPNTGDLLTNAEMHSVEHCCGTARKRTRWCTSAPWGARRDSISCLTGSS